MFTKTLGDFLSFSISDMSQIHIKFGLETSSRFYVLSRILWRFCWRTLNQRCLFTIVPKEIAKSSSHPSLSFLPAFVSPSPPLYLILVFFSLLVPPKNPTQWPFRTSNCMTVTLFLLWSPCGWAYTVSPSFLYDKDNNKCPPSGALGPCFSGLLCIYYSFPPLSRSFQKSCV